MSYTKVICDNMEAGLYDIHRAIDILQDVSGMARLTAIKLLSIEMAARIAPEGFNIVGDLAVINGGKDA